MASKICILDDDPAFLQAMQAVLVGGYEVVAAESVERFREVFTPRRFDLIVLDMRLEEATEGMEVLREVHAADPYQPVVVATAYADTETYLGALQEGALLYVDKARYSPAALALLFDAVIQQGRLRREQVAVTRALERMDPAEIMGTSESIRALRAEIDRLAGQTGVIFVVVGEIGSGRELVVRNLHAHGQKGLIRPLALFAPQALPVFDLARSLLGSDLPRLRKRGLLEEAHGSGLVVRVSNQLPSEILRLIVDAWANHQFRPEGSSAPRPLEGSLYFICDDSAPIEDALADKSVVWLRVPPLRERKDDIPLLATYLLDAMRRRGREGPSAMGPDVTKSLLSHDWPGNVAELKAALEYATLRAAADGQHVIGVRHLPFAVAGAGALDELNSQRRWDMEYQEARVQVALVESAIRELSTSNKTKLAGFLGVQTPTTLARRIERCLKRYPILESEFARVADAFAERQLTSQAAGSSP